MQQRLVDLSTHIQWEVFHIVATCEGSLADDSVGDQSAMLPPITAAIVFVLHIYRSDT